MGLGVSEQIVREKVMGPTSQVGTSLFSKDILNKKHPPWGLHHGETRAKQSGTQPVRLTLHSLCTWLNSGDFTRS